MNAVLDRLAIANANRKARQGAKPPIDAPEGRSALRLAWQHFNLTRSTPGVMWAVWHGDEWEGDVGLMRSIEFAWTQPPHPLPERVKVPDYGKRK